MLIIPAIDLSKGRCVRLVRGQRKEETVYSADPVEVACRWQEQGAPRLHLVDLDGAFDGFPQNKEVIAEIVKALHIPVQLGGGLRDLRTLENVFQLGVEKAILGTLAVEDPPLMEELASAFGSRLMVAIDAREGVVAVRGWVKETALKAVELAHRVFSLGLQEIIYTDISRDGMLSGPNLAALEEITSVQGLNIIASGGIAGLDDIRSVRRLENRGVSGVIVGKALYDEHFTLEEALAVSDERR